MLHLLRVIHIVLGAFWFGSIVFLHSFIVPTIRALGPAGGPVMAHLGQQRKMPQWLVTAGALTILSGAGLYWRDSGGLQMAWIATPMGTTLTIGASLALLAFLIGVVVNAPSAKRLGAIMGARGQAKGPPSPEEVAEIAVLQARMGKGQLAAVILLTLATMAMAVARYTT
jgi:drug/metabolite transporter (DMT)-like permease